MPGYRLTARDFVMLAEKLPQRPQVQALHEYIEDVRALVNAEDTISIPESHKGLMRGENHEGSSRLNSRIRQLAAWFSHGQIRPAVSPSGPGDDVQVGASLQERFMRLGEESLARGTGLHNWKQEAARDLAECGVSVIQQHPRTGYYVKVRANPDAMADGSALKDVIWRRRVDPLTFAWEEGPDGEFTRISMKQTRTLGEIAREIGLEAAERMLGYFDFGEPIDPGDLDSAGDPRFTVETSEVWGPENGALVVTGGPNAKAGFKRSSVGRVLKEWDNPIGKPPFYMAAPGVWPWHSPLDEMVQLTNIRNYWATMLEIQASGSVFRNWQLKDTNTQETIDLGTLPKDAVPEHLIYDPSKPPPDMGPGREWILAPFEFHDVLPRYQLVKADHEQAGASVARLTGQVISAGTAVGTVDAIDSSAQQEFSEYVEAIESQTVAMWVDLFRWLRTEHKDPLYIHDKVRDPVRKQGFVAMAVSLAGKDVVSEDISARLDTRSKLERIADLRFFLEAHAAGLMDYNRGVEIGLIWGVDDAEAEKQALLVAEGAEIEGRVLLLQKQQQAMMRAGLMPQEQPQHDPRFMRGRRTDPRGTGAGQGSENASNTALAAGGSDLARSA